MMKKFIFQFSAVCLTAMLFVFTGCQDKDYYDPNVRPNDNKDASTLDFSTTRTVELSLNYDVVNGYVSTYDLYTENPLNEDGTLKAGVKPISGGISIAGASPVRVLPAYATELYAHSTDLFIPKLMRAEVKNGVASFEPFAYTSETVEPETRTVGGNGNGVNKYLTKASDYYSEYKDKPRQYKYDLISPVKTVSFPAEILSDISQSFPDDKEAKAEYFQDAVVKILSTGENNTGANVYISLILADGSFRNSLSYFVYTSETKDIASLTKKEREKLKLTNVFQLADMYNNPWKINNGSSYRNQGLSAGKAVKLQYVDNDGNYGDTFPIGAQIGFVLHSDRFNDSFDTFKSGNYIYSIADWNTSKKKKTVFFGAKDSKNVEYSFFGFEDQIDAKVNDCNDVMFHVLTDPIDAIKPPVFIPKTGTIEKKASHSGILAFEDNWPRKLDYDLNDVVVKYNSTVTYVQDGKTTETSNGELVGYGDVTVKRIEDVLSFIHTGADFKNGFSYKVDIDPAKITEIKVTDHKNQTVNYSAKADGTGFIIDLCPNVADVIPAMQPVTEPAVYTVKMEFDEKAVTELGFEKLQAPYNPFIMPENTTIESEMIEVHLPFYYPTTRADMSLFGTCDDVSKVGENIYYAAEKGTYYPFALHLAGAEDFAIPTEGLSIENSYPKYTDWVNSGCSSNTEWYK